MIPWLDPKALKKLCLQQLRTSQHQENPSGSCVRRAWCWDESAFCFVLTKRRDQLWGSYVWKSWDLPASPAWYFIMTTFTTGRIVHCHSISSPTSLSLPCSIPILCPSPSFTWQMFFIQNLSMMREPSKYHLLMSANISLKFSGILEPLSLKVIGV